MTDRIDLTRIGPINSAISKKRSRNSHHMDSFPSSFLLALRAFFLSLKVFTILSPILYSFLHILFLWKYEIIPCLLL